MTHALKSWVPSVLVAFGLLASCTPPPQAAFDQAVMEDTVSQAVGDIGVCVILVNQTDHREVWHHGRFDDCNAKLASCTAAGPASARDRARLIGPAPMTRSCDAGEVGRSIAWAEGQAGPGLLYVAILQTANEQAVPGRELATRLSTAFRKAGLAQSSEPGS